MGVGKPRGLWAARQLRNHRRDQKSYFYLFQSFYRWNDKDYNKRLLGSRWRNPFMGSSHAKGLVVEKFGVESK